MNWHLLNQHYVSLDFKNYEISVLEEVISSELQLVLLLVSGTVSFETMTSLFRGTGLSQKEIEDLSRVI